METQAFVSAARTYLTDVLIQKVGLTGVALVSDRPRAKVYSARFRDERAAIKLFPPEKARIARRTAVIRGVYEAEGIPTYDLLWHDLRRFDSCKKQLLHRHAFIAIN